MLVDWNKSSTYNAKQSSRTGRRPMALSPRHQAFARAVVDGASFAAAARKAGYSEANARHQGAALIRNPEIQDLVHELLAEREAERSEAVTVLVEHLYRLLDLSMRQVAIKEAQIG